MFKLSELIFLLVSYVVLAQNECNLRKCHALKNELTTCASAVMENYGKWAQKSE